MGAFTNAVKWFKSYLTERKQSVRIGSTVPISLSTFHGVPQGTILSPLFSIYTNDFPSTVSHTTLKSYVDDSKIILSFVVADTDCSKHLLEEDVYSIGKRCSENNLLINPGRTKYILIGHGKVYKSIIFNFFFELKCKFCSSRFFS